MSDRAVQSQTGSGIKQASSSSTATAAGTTSATTPNGTVTEDTTSTDSPGRKTSMWGKLGGGGTAAEGGMDMREKFKLKARQVIDLTNIKNAITALHSMHKLRKDSELLSTIRSANLGLEERVEETNKVLDEDESFMDDAFLGFDRREVYNSPRPSLLSPSKIDTFGDAGLITLEKIHERKREREKQHQKKLEAAIRNAGTISAKEREHYVTMCSHFELMAAKLKRRDDMIRQMRHYLQLDTMIRASGGHGLQERMQKHGEHANSVHEQISTLRRALQSGDECEILQLHDEVDVLYREFKLLSDAMEISKQKMDHMVSHSRTVALANEK